MIENDNDKEKEKEIKISNTTYIYSLSTDIILFISRYLDLIDIGCLSISSKIMSKIISHTPKNIHLLQCRIDYQKTLIKHNDLLTGYYKSTERPMIHYGLMYSLEKNDWFDQKELDISSDLVMSDIHRVECLVIALQTGLSISSNTKIILYCPNGIYFLSKKYFKVIIKLLEIIGQYVWFINIPKTVLHHRSNILILDEIKNHIPNIVEIQIMLNCTLFSKYQTFKKKSWTMREDEYTKNRGGLDPEVLINMQTINSFKKLNTLVVNVQPNSFVIYGAYKNNSTANNTIKNLYFGGSRNISPHFTWDKYFLSLEYITFENVCLIENPTNLPKIKTLKINNLYSKKSKKDLVEFLRTKADKIIIKNFEYKHTFFK
jgi:hypothetical protein